MRMLAIVSLGCAAMLGVEVHDVRAAQRGPHYVVGWLPVSPAPVRSDGEFHYVYEIQFTSYFPVAQRLESIEVRAGGDEGVVLASYAGDDLIANMIKPGVREPDPETLNLLEPGGSVVVFFMTSSPTSAPLPTSLVHEVTFQRTGAQVGAPPGVLEMVVEVQPQSETVAIGAPLRGGPWLVANGLSNTSGHRRTPLPQDGRPDFAQRYAIDYIMPAGRLGELFEGDEPANESYYAWDQEIIAVADGVITAVAGGMIDNPVVGQVTDQVQISLDNAGGNTLIQDIGDGRYASYAHIKRGSIRVKVGDRVRRGQVLGLVGNSGNSTGPHLHFHVGDRSDHVLRTEGLAYVHHHFEWIGTCEPDEDVVELACELDRSEMRFGEMPKRNDVVIFPERDP